MSVMPSTVGGIALTAVTSTGSVHGPTRFAIYRLLSNEGDVMEENKFGSPAKAIGLLGRIFADRQCSSPNTDLARRVTGTTSTASYQYFASVTISSHNTARLGREDLVKVNEIGDC